MPLIEEYLHLLFSQRMVLPPIYDGNSAGHISLLLVVDGLHLFKDGLDCFLPLGHESVYFREVNHLLDEIQFLVCEFGFSHIVQ